MKLFLFIFFVSSAFANSLKLDDYLKIQEALAADDFKSSLISHEMICKKELTPFLDEYKDCKRSFKDIEDLRASFKKLSEIYIKHGSKKEIEALMKATCPMAGANWIQRKGKIANPYYGKSMLECGEKI